MSLLLTEAELREITGYRQESKQLIELHRQGFFRARRTSMGMVILERAHYEAVCAGNTAKPSTQRPTPRLQSA